MTRRRHCSIRLAGNGILQIPDSRFLCRPALFFISADNNSEIRKLRIFSWPCSKPCVLH